MSLSPPSAPGDMNATSDSCVVDTDVLSYIFRGDSRAHQFGSYLAGKQLLVSFMTVAELDRWILSRNWGQPRRERLEAFLQQFLLVLPDREMCRTWAEVEYQARRNGRPIQVADAWIAATAVSLRVPLVTHNRADYAGVSGLVLAPDIPSQ